MRVTSLAELARLPQYCRGAQQIAIVSGDKTPSSEYMRIYGVTFSHLHHYCWALNEENHAMLIRDKILKDSGLRNALGDIQYVLDRADPTFILMPEILNSKARILNQLGRHGEAVTALTQAINANPSYIPTYTQLSDIYEAINLKEKAIAILQDGLRHFPGNATIIKRILRLGGIPDPKYATKPTPPANVKAAPNDAPATSPSVQIPEIHIEKPSTISPALNLAPSAPSNNNAAPFCRFCP